MSNSILLQKAKLVSEHQHRNLPAKDRNASLSLKNVQYCNSVTTDLNFVY